MASKDSQDWNFRQWNTMSLTICSADYRCFELCRLIIANAILSIKSPKNQANCLKELCKVNKKDKPTEKDKEIEKCCEEYNSVEKKDDNLDESLKEREFVINLCKNDKNRFESLIEGEDDENEEDFKLRCEDKNFFEGLRSRVAERELKYIKTQKLADVIKARQIITSQLISIIKDKKIYKWSLPIDLQFNPESRGLINEIKLELKARHDSLFEQYAHSENDIPETTLTAAGSWLDEELVQPPLTVDINYIDGWLNTILQYRNKIAHSPVFEFDLKKLYNIDTTISQLCHPYVSFLQYVDFKKYFCAKSLKEKVNDFLYPLAIGAEIEMTLKYERRRVDQDARGKKFEDLLEKVTSLKEGTEELESKERELIELQARLDARNQEKQEERRDNLNTSSNENSEEPESKRQQLTGQSAIDQEKPTLEKRVNELKKSLSECKEDRKRKEEGLTKQVNEMMKGEELLRQIIQDQKRISERMWGEEIRCILDDIINYGGDRPHVLKAGLNRLHMITMHMERRMPDNLFNAIKNSWRPLN